MQHTLARFCVQRFLLCRNFWGKFLTPPPSQKHNCPSLTSRYFTTSQSLFLRLLSSYKSRFGQMRAILSVKSVVDYEACSHGSEGPRAGEVPRPGGVTNLSIQSLFFSWLRSHVRWDTPPRRITRSACPGNPLSWGEFSPCESYEVG